MADYPVERATPGDLAALVELVRTSVPSAYLPLLEPHLSVSDWALGGGEHVLLARDRAGGAVTGVTVFGVVPGTSGAGRIRGVAVAPLARRRGVGHALLRAALDALRDLDARFVLVELPDDPLMRFFEALLSASGFVEEARASDLVREGVAMRYLRRDLRA